MFLREAETLARLKHPNIAAIYESGHTEDGHDYFAMELVRGKTLDRWLRVGPTTDRRRRARAAAAGVPHALRRRPLRPPTRRHPPRPQAVEHHRRRPERPSASGTDSDGRGRSVKILDFGLARITDADIAATMVSEVGLIKGTLPYMSPEQARGDVAAIDVRTDVYALGVILYELLAGERPYDVSRAALAEAVRVICEEPRRPLRQGWSGSAGSDRDLETIVGKASKRRSTGATAAPQPSARTSTATSTRSPSWPAHRARCTSSGRWSSATDWELPSPQRLAAARRLRGHRDPAEPGGGQQRDRAEDEAAKAQAVTRFMTETLSAANPWGQGYDVTVTEALDQATEKIAASFAGPAPRRGRGAPRHRHRVQDLGRYDRARTLLEAADETRTRLLGRDEPETIDTLAASRRAPGATPDSTRPSI